MVIRSKKKIVLFALINVDMPSHKGELSIPNNKRLEKPKRKVL